LPKELKEYPENTERCVECLNFRTQKMAKYLLNNHFDMVSSTFLISLFKDAEKVEK
jgi:predicted adenine nucleotide alpha hydrolase (AANH) superfamily ATPase